MFAQRSRAEAAPRGKAAAPPASKPAPFDPLYLPLDLSYPGLSKVCEKPPIFVCEDFLSAAECEQLIKVSGPLLQRSKTHAAAGSEATNGRTSLGDDLHEAVLTFDDALAWAKAHPACQGFTYQSADRRPTKPTRVWFKSRLRVLHADGWYTYSVGKQN